MALVRVNNSTKDYLVCEKGIELFSKYTWFATAGDYPYLRRKLPNGKVSKFHIELMQKEILEAVKDSRVIVDHINGNVFDNRRDNLRVRTQSENNMNKKVQTNNTSGIVGVAWNTHDRLWNVSISKEGERYYLGSYYYLRNAVKKRIKAEDEYFGEHSLYHRDETYRDLVDSILNLENIDEPIFTPRRGRYGINGVSKHKGKFRARITYEGNEESVIKDELESAILWRTQKEVEIYGRKLFFIDEKIDKQI